ncbi:J domain-containing protein [Nocardioides sp. MAHUQ-72]|uniref:J domain-containing protein n=1 Tax=unclassified Nocardioides TaxID=2615069 RepID=UPI00360985BA
MNPSWYDLLGVEPGASETEIRAAWKGAIADLDPTDRRFRVCNLAAEVLLDPERRAAYDAQLAAEQVDDEPVDVPGDDPVEEEGAPAASTAPATAIVPGAPATTAKHAPRPRRGVPGWALAAVGVLAALAVGAAAWIWVAEPSDASVEESTRAAQAAAERAVGPILSYDAKHLDEDQQAAESYMTSDYRKDYDQLFEVIKQNAPGTETVVKAQVVASGIVRSGDDRVDVLLFVNRPTTNKKTPQPVVYKDQVTVTMQKVGGEWLVDDMVTSPVAG